MNKRIAGVYDVTELRKTKNDNYDLFFIGVFLGAFLALTAVLIIIQ